MQLSDMVNGSILIRVFEAFSLNGQHKETPFSKVKLTVLKTGDDTEEITTDENGQACFNNLTPGDYVIQAEKKHFRFTRQDQHLVHLVHHARPGHLQDKDPNKSEAAVRKISTAWRMKSTEDENHARPQNEIRVTVTKGKESYVKIVGGMYNHDPLPDSWFTSDGSEKKAVSEITYDSCLENLYEAMKVVTLVIVFLLTLGAAVASRGATFFMVSQLSGKTLNICNWNWNNPMRAQGGSQVSNTPMEKVAWLWCIFFAFAIPEVLHYLKSLNAYLSQNIGMIGFLSKFLHRQFMASFLFVLILEAGHVLGTGILFFHTLPRLDSMTAIMMTSGGCLLPGLLKTIRDFRTRAWIQGSLSVLAVVVLVVAMVLFSVMVEDDQTDVWLTPLALVLTSLGWWQSYAGARSFHWLHKIKMTVNEKDSCFINMTLALWKILLFFGCLSVIPYLNGTVLAYKDIFTNFSLSFDVDEHHLMDPAHTGFVRSRRYTRFTETPWFVLIIQLSTTLFAYNCGRFACKLGDIRILFTNVKFSFAATCLTLVSPISITILTLLCDKRSRDPCSVGWFPDFQFFTCPAQPLDTWSLVVGILMFVAYIWITSHVWKTTTLVLASEVQIFGCNFHSGLMVDQAMMLSRRMEEDDEVEDGKKSKEPEDVEHSGHENTKTLDKNIRIMGCATMWHENSEEIKVMLKSVFKLDDDLYARRKALDLLPKKDQDKKSFTDLEKKKKEEVHFFEWETHIFFDDCMAPIKKEELEKGKKENVNDYVKDLIGAVDDYGKKWYSKNGLGIPELTKFITPYGGTENNLT